MQSEAGAGGEGLTHFHYFLRKSNHFLLSYIRKYLYHRLASQEGIRIDLAPTSSHHIGIVLDRLKSRIESLYVSIDFETGWIFLDSSDLRQELEKVSSRENLLWLEIGASYDPLSLDDIRIPLKAI